MCADRISGSISNQHLQNGQNDPICVAVTVDINDIFDGALKVLKHIKPFWPINNVQFKVGSKECVCVCVFKLLVFSLRLFNHHFGILLLLFFCYCYKNFFLDEELLWL